MIPQDSTDWRMISKRRRFWKPPATSWSAVDDMLPDDVETALGLLESAGTAGNLTTDAQIAAVAFRLDAEVHTADLDFGRFAGVRFSKPL
jgi:predicted nucleic acid-binding protein